MRYLTKHILQDIKRKLILLTGPRQCGKTTLSKSLFKSYSYLNYDVPEDRIQIIQRSWDRKKNCLILDELHKLKNWKQYLKGIIDSDEHKLPTIVTGSARLDLAKKVGDSLAGRFFQFRLHPLDVKEAVRFFDLDADTALERIMTVGGFPEPFLANSPGYYRRWRRSHLDVILRQDLIELESVENITQIETLVELLRTRVGKTVSYQNLANDLQCAPKSVKRWLGILENLYVVFSLRPYFRNISRSLIRSPKYYFYDCAAVNGNDGAKFENLIALALKKEIEFRQDCLGDELACYFLRNKDGDEVDFLITKDAKPHQLIEAKLSDDTPHKGFNVFAKQLGLSHALQLVKELNREKSYPSGLEVRKASKWLKTCEI